ncbi:DUF5050 domain-containing protein [Schinkia azotoformans]|uniref:DUF5050 domain-containing protein n=1 Tax=Schinkia azotoformans TaxID=1454 RepID=UPI002E242414|nr:DUF5050 domain-containing protein [Schinkia azotoformans]
MIKAFLKLTIAMGLCLNILSAPVGHTFAADKTVRVTLPNFTVQLNGNKVDNQYRQYPLIVYKDMTYVPMTWFDSRLLGLKTGWSEKDGLTISEDKVTTSYEPYKTKQKNSKSQNATIPTFKITVNGKRINNSKEEFPLLNVRNVTYFPLTWKFAHDEFGWEYVWDKSKGLIINSNNPKVQTVNLPSYAGENDVTLFDGYYYFVETTKDKNNIYRVPETNPTKKQLVYSYNGESTYGFPKWVNFEVRDNALWLSYHVGGATMGYDIYARINADGKATVEQSGYRDFKYSPKGTLIINQSVPPGGNNLTFIPNGQAEEAGIQIGDPNLIYGWYIKKDKESTGYGPVQSTTILGDDVYVLASSSEIENNDLNKIYKINLNTNETTQITNFSVRNFKISGNKLFYVKNSDQILYSSNLDGSSEQKLSDNNKVGWFGEIEGNVFYTSEVASGQYKLYKVDTTKEDTLIMKEPVALIQIANGKIICQLSLQEDYGIKVFNKSGQLDLAIVDHTENLFVHNDQILIISAKDKTIKTIHLKK